MKIVLYDGDCGLCNRTVIFIFKRDPGGVFSFASIQSTIGRKLLAQHGISDPQLDTFYLLDDDKLYSKSDAAVRVGQHLHRWGWFAAFVGWWPRCVRDWCYDRIANNRHRFGKKNACELAPPETKQRFLDQ